LREELEALDLYLQLEELRFGEKFEYTVHVDEDIDIDYYEVPPLILQPYVENAILHKGLLEIKIKREGSYIICTVLDNGIGRKQAMEMKGEILKKPHVSHGTRITRERLEILNRSFHSELSVNITDLDSQNGTAAGTRVDVFIPA
jgi:sensor histidine kinase YesM